MRVGFGLVLAKAVANQQAGSLEFLQEERMTEGSIGPSMKDATV
jgi:hypothetical protein